MLLNSLGWAKLEVLLPKPPKVLGLQACAVMPGLLKYLKEIPDAIFVTAYEHF